MKRYRLIGMYQAYQSGYPDSSDTDPSDYRTALYEFENNNPIRLIAVDGGEPEDQTFYRDWSWVVDELNKIAEEDNHW